MGTTIRRATPLNVEMEFISAIHSTNDRRPLNEDAVCRLVDSINRLGVRVPLAVRTVDEFDIPGEGPVSNVRLLVAGAHRLEACRRIGLQEVPVVEIPDETDARLWEISENLHRCELSVQERADHIAEWVKITELSIKAQNAPLAHPRGRPDQGINAAVRDLGIDRTEAQRAVKIASITPEARAAADAAGLTTQSARLAVAKAAPEQQVNKVAEISAARTKPAPAIKNAFESEEDWRRALFTVWNRGAQDWRDRALETFDRPIFDHTSAGAA